MLRGVNWALRLTLWNDQMEEEKKTEKSNNKTHKKIEHGGENSYHALCCVFEVLMIQGRTRIVKANLSIPSVKK